MHMRLLARFPAWAAGRGVSVILPFRLSSYLHCYAASATARSAQCERKVGRLGSYKVSACAHTFKLSTVQVGPLVQASQGPQGGPSASSLHLRPWLFLWQLLPVCACSSQQLSTSLSARACPAAAQPGLPSPRLPQLLLSSQLAAGSSVSLIFQQVMGPPRFRCATPVPPSFLCDAVSRWCEYRLGSPLVGYPSWDRPPSSTPLPLPPPPRHTGALHHGSFALWPSRPSAEPEAAG